MKKLKTIAQRKKWNMILGISDIIMMIIASYLALLTRFEFYPSQIAPIFLKNAAKYMPLNLFCSIVIFMAYRLYSTQWKYAGISDFINVVKAVVIAAAFQLIGIYMLQWEIPRSYYFLYLVYLLLGMFFIRLLVRLIQGSEPLKVNDIGKKKVPVMLIGAGEAGSIILNEIKDPRICPMTSVVEVEVAPDLKTCKAYISVLGDEKSQQETIKGLKSAEGYIRTMLAKSINLRNTPQITFILDQSIEYGVKMSKMIDDVTKDIADKTEE